MNKEQTLAIIKPLAFEKGYTGPIIGQIEVAGFQIKVISSGNLNLEDAKTFYEIHADKPFYQDLCKKMASGPIIIMVLEKENAVADFRKLIGPTNPVEAAPDTLRKQFGESIDHNAVHGSDSPETAENEIRFFFGSKKSRCQGNCACDNCTC